MEALRVLVVEIQRQLEDGTPRAGLFELVDALEREVAFMADREYTRKAKAS